VAVGRIKARGDEAPPLLRDLGAGDTDLELPHRGLVAAVDVLPHLHIADRLQSLLGGLGKFLQGCPKGAVEVPATSRNREQRARPSKNIEARPKQKFVPNELEHAGKAAGVLERKIHQHDKEVLDQVAVGGRTTTADMRGHLSSRPAEQGGMDTLDQVCCHSCTTLQCKGLK
jgi:hypothetical protein